MAQTWLLVCAHAYLRVCVRVCTRMCAGLRARELFTRCACGCVCVCVCVCVGMSVALFVGNFQMLPDNAPSIGSSVLPHAT